MAHSLKNAIEKYRAVFYTEDKASIALVAAILISSKMQTPPVWLYLIGPSSSGKSELIDVFSKVPFVHQVSDLTPNTFLSGMHSTNQETSLLHKLGLNFTITMKDFTTLLQKPEETQGAIIAQMREIYDGHIVKETGNGKRAAWGEPERGKATFIMAVTERIFKMQDQFSDMGTRAINYVLLPQDRVETTRRALQQTNTLEVAKEQLRTIFADLIDEKVKNLPKEFPPLDSELQDQIIEIANFSSIGRSVVDRDYRGAKSLAYSAEMPMRMAKQLLMVAQAFIFLNGELEPYLKECVFKIGLDSIPKQRRIALEAMAKYQKVTIGGLCDLINYPDERTKAWVEDLFSFGIVRRIKASGKQYWELKEEYRKIMIKYLGVKPIDADLETDEDGTAFSTGGGNYKDMSYEEIEAKRINDAAVQRAFDNI